MQDKKVKRIEVLSGVTLESAYAATQAEASRMLVESYQSEKATLFISYLTGAAETTNSVQVIVEGYVGGKAPNTNHPYSSTENSDISADSGYWVQLGEHVTATGTATYTPTVYNVAGASGSTTYTGVFQFDINYLKLRVAAKETGVATNKGTITAVVLVQ
jgi:hypothetical protein